MKLLFVFTLWCTAIVNVHGQPLSLLVNYTSNSIPDSLKAGADAVYRLDEALVEIVSPSVYNYKVHRIITLFNKDAAHHLRQVLSFDKNDKIEELTVTTYNSVGQKFKTYKKSDARVQAYNDNVSLVQDNKLIILDCVAPAYPCTIEVSYQQRIESYINLPGWTFTSAGEAVEQSKFTVVVPASLDIRSKMYGIDIKPEVSLDGNVKKYVWEAKNLVASKKREPNGFVNLSNNPTLLVAPNNFEYEKYVGKFDSWKSFGAWNYVLYNDDKPFTSDQATPFLVMTADCKTNGEKISVLYNFLKQNMRYVGIQLGIGGFKPFPIQYVHEKKYGDCKALTNYMRYMLKTVGIESYPALINSGSNKLPVDRTFPIDYFDHVILCVPQPNDTTWLECTSNYNAAGHLGSFTENRLALLLTENGGKLANTPESRSSDNLQQTNTTILVDEEGSTDVKQSLYCTGDIWPYFYYMKQQTDADIKVFFTKRLGYKQGDAFALTASADSARGGKFQLEIGYDQGYDFKAGNKYFFPQTIQKICDLKPSNVERTEPYLFDHPRIITDTTLYKIPVNWVADQLPADMEIDTKYIHYKRTISKDRAPSSIYISTLFEIKKRVVAPADYKLMVATITEINKLEGQKLVLKQQ